MRRIGRKLKFVGELFLLKLEKLMTTRQIFNSALEEKVIGFSRPHKWCIGGFWQYDFYSELVYLGSL